jgi:vacuolar-type H+-ATPase subunit F/Vma7
MGAPVYLGDELSAAGFRLAGLDARVPAAGTESAALAEALASAEVVLVSATVAARLPEAALHAALRAASPLTVIVPDLRLGTAFADLAARLRRQLGIES